MGFSRTSFLNNPDNTANATAFAGLGRVNAPAVNQAVQQQASGQGGGRGAQSAVNILNDLLRNFGDMIGLPDLELNEQNRSSLLLGEGNSAVQVTMELAPDESLCLYTILDKQPDGVMDRIKEFIANQPASQDGTYLSLSGSGTTVFLCLNTDLRLLNGLDFETLVRNFYAAANEWRRKYEKLALPIPASSAMLSRPAAQDRDFIMEIYIDKATGFLAIAYIIYRMGGLLA
ncbi:MAG: type III secretion system chaperone [Acidobacteriota bacterium]